MKNSTLADRGPFDRWAARVEAALLSLILLGVVFATGIQIVLRNVGENAMPGLDPLVRASVLWLGLLGAVAAAREFRHIRIDLLARLLPNAVSRWIDSAVALVTAAISALVAWHGGRMVLDERAYGAAIAQDVPAWVLQSIIPIGFGFMALAYLVQAILQARRKGRPV